MAQIRHVGSGKVREIFEVDEDEILLVATDRISAYDVVLPQAIPDKGKVLTGLSYYWLDVLDSFCPNHMISVKADQLPDVGMDDLAGRAMLCIRARPLPVEFTVRGYLAGSGLKDYRTTGEVCGHRLPEGLREADRLPQTLLTPATKATSGHDENISEDQAASIVGPEHYEEARELALKLYEVGASIALERGIIIADTKFEFGLAEDGKVILIDEVLTPDSSRFWPADEHEPGRSQASWDKQYVRDWLDDTGWDHSPPPPALPSKVVNATGQRYVEAYERITDRPLASWFDEVNG